MYNKYTFDHHGLKLKEIQRTNGQNWALVQRIFQRKVQKCFNML
jgi:phage protein U